MEQLDLLRRAVETFERLDITYLLVGSMASGAYGEPRMTRDIDIVADLRLEHVPLLRAAFPPSEYYLSADAAVEAVRSRGQFNIIHSNSANKIDVIIPRRGPWEDTQLTRRRRLPLFPDRECFVAAPEDVVIAKMRWYRDGGSERHLRDCVGILKVSGELIDRDYVEHWTSALDLHAIWRKILERAALR